MWSVLLTEIRPDRSVPYFRQHPGDRGTWFPHVRELYSRLSPKLKHYNVRFSDDLLTRYIITTFDDKETLDELNSDPWFQIREAANRVYCESRGITYECSTVFHEDAKSLDDYMMEIVNRTWPRSQVLVTDAFLPRMDPNDRLLTNASKPENDTWELHPWYLKIRKD